MSDRENYHQYTHDEFYGSSLGEPTFEKGRYLTLHGTERNKFGDITIYGKVDNLFLTYESSSNVGTESRNVYLRGVYFASSTQCEYGLFKYFIIFDNMSYHSKFEIEAIRNHCLSIKQC